MSRQSLPWPSGSASPSKPRAYSSASLNASISPSLLSANAASCASWASFIISAFCSAVIGTDLSMARILGQVP